LSTITRVVAIAATFALSGGAALAAVPASAAPAQVAPGAEGYAGLGHRKMNLGPGLATAHRAARAAADTPPVGTVRSWLANDLNESLTYRKNYTLRGIGDKIEVWVADDLSFPAGDCRSQIPGSTEVTDAQVAALVTEFDTNIYPHEVAALSTPPDRNGTNATIDGDFTGAGDRTVTLIDNIRDANYLSFPANPSFLSGFVSSAFNQMLDRNVMTIDAYDWAHRTGANPPDEPTGDPCTSRASRPRGYEGVFAHEWQHLLQYYADPAEADWLNEGLSDYATNLTGYSDPTRTVYEAGHDGHLRCFQGYGTTKTAYNPNPVDCGGPENSLTLWGESASQPALLADYGNAYGFLLYLKSRFGVDFVSALHRDGSRQGLDSLAALLSARGVTDVSKVLHDYQTMVLTDAILDDSRTSVALGISKGAATAANFRSSLNLANPSTHVTPGAAPNGADYVSLGGGSSLRSVSFRGDRILPPRPLEWTVSDGVLFSGNNSSSDASAVTSVTVPQADPVLTFQASYGAEEGFDFGYVIVSTDGGSTYTAVAGDKTVAGPRGPGVNGATDGFEKHTYDLSAYAGKSILLGFHYVSDSSFNAGGWRIDDITLGGSVINDGTSLDEFDTVSEIKPATAAWNLRLIGLDAKRHVVLQRDFGSRDVVRLSKAELAALRLFPEVVAVVTFDEPTEKVSQYAPYTLEVNGVIQPGGR